MRCKLISSAGNSALVEWDDGHLHRARVPLDAVGEEGEVAQEILQAGISYGADWEQAIRAAFVPEDVADALRRHGFWTVEDVRKRPGEVVLLLRRLSLNFSDLLKEV